MNTYNKFMKYFWLAIGIVTLLAVTIMGFIDGFDRWYQYYLFSAIGFMMFFMKSWMMKRFEKQMEYMEKQRKNKE